MRSIQTSPFGALRIESDRGASDANHVGSEVSKVRLFNTYLTNTGTDTVEQHPGIYVRGRVKSLHFDGQSGLPQTNSTIQLSHQVFINLQDNQPITIPPDWHINIHLNDAEVAVLGRGDSTNILEMPNLTVDVAASRGQYPAGTVAKLFDSRFNSSNTRVSGRVGTGKVPSGFLDLTRVQMNGEVYTQTPFNQVLVGDSISVLIHTSGANGESYYKQILQAVGNNGVVIPAADVIRLGAAVTSISFSIGLTRYKRFEVVNTSANLVKVTGVKGGTRFIGPSGGLIVNQQGSDYYADTPCHAALYTPPFSAGTNISAPPAGIGSGATYKLNSDEVEVTGRVSVTTIAAGPSSFSISLPVPSDLTDLSDLSGSAMANVASASAQIVADIENNTALVNFTAAGATTYGSVYRFRYRAK
ncbi:hypothetical protein [Mangrovicella endophytica]|uniref:hypothetical protein n=1 Tax=Mangrovicella endophytica TaxID=2066697 RepID=UPI0012FFDDBC|nr:hypothetical protein [Mangrovicella endophytica]